MKCSTEGQLQAIGLLDVLEVHEHPLGGLGPEVDRGVLRRDGPEGRLEHQVELALLGEVLRAAARAEVAALGVGLRSVVGAEPGLALQAVDERVVEAVDVARGPPDRGVHDDGAVEPDHVLAAVDHGAPPLVHHVPLELDPERAVVVGRLEPAVDLARGEDEAAPLAQRDDLLHQLGLAALLVLLHGGRGV
jgi:hypothetical protein